MSIQYDFDKIIDRTGSGDLKHGVLQERYGRSDLLPLWVADMDFETPRFITDALRQRLEHSLFGYTVVPDALWTSITQWIQDHYPMRCGPASLSGFRTTTSGTSSVSGSPIYLAS